MSTVQLIAVVDTLLPLLPCLQEWRFRGHPMFQFTSYLTNLSPTTCCFTGYLSNLSPTTCFTSSLSNLSSTTCHFIGYVSNLSLTTCRSTSYLSNLSPTTCRFTSYLSNLSQTDSITSFPASHQPTWKFSTSCFKQRPHFSSHPPS